MKYLIVFLIFTYSVCAQESLSLQKAMALALEKNLKIKIASVDSSIATTIGDQKIGSFLPKANVQAGVNRGYVATNTLSDGRWSKEIYSVGASLDYTLFDGLRMFYAYDWATAKTKHGIQIAKLSVEKEILALYGKYLKASVSQKLTRVLEQKWKNSIEILKDQSKRAEVGAISSRQLLQWKVQSNTLHSQYLQQVRREKQAMDILAIALQTDLKNTLLEFVWEGSFEPRPEKEWLKLASENNSSLKVQALQEYMALQQQGISRASFWPWLVANSSISSQSSSISLSNPSYVGSVGVRLSWNLFNGLADRSKVAEASLNKRKALLNKEKMQYDIQIKIQQNLQEIEHLEQQILFEKEAWVLAKENTLLQKEQMGLGVGSYLEFVDAQNQAESSEIRLLQAQTESYLLGLELQHLAGIFKL